MSDYEQFLKTKQHPVLDSGKAIDRSHIHCKLFEWQRDIVVWATKKGRCAVFLDTGLGKTFIQLEWARLLGENTLIIAPLSVARQTVKEARKIDLDVRYVRGQTGIVPTHKLWITNYEMADQFDFSQFGAVVLDESSILKAIGGKTRQKLTALCASVPYRLCCTATPAPNDYIELGNHTEFLGICKMNEMLATFFVNANKEHTFDYEGIVYRKKGHNKDGTEWRLKHHAEQAFFKWLSSWAITMTLPSDLGYDNDGFILPPLNINPVFMNSEYQPKDQLFFTSLHGISDRLKVRRATLDGKLAKLAEIVSSPNFCYNNRYEQTRIYETMDSEKQETHSPVSGTNERAAECSQAGIVCQGRIPSDSTEKTGQGLAEEQPGTGTHSRPEAIRDRPSTVCSDTSTTGEPMRHMRDAIGQCETVPLCGSLSQDRQGQRITLHELQYGDREDEGLTSITQKSRRIFGTQSIIWCGLDVEQHAIAKLLGDRCVSIYGTLSADEKERRIEQWLNGEVEILLSKGKICGFGLNLQQAHQMIFFGMNDSWETYYQCIRREWRYGQANPVNVYLLLHEVEQEIYQNIMRKDAMAKRLKAALIDQIKDYEKGELGMESQMTSDYVERTVTGKGWTAMLGDSCQRLKEVAENSIDLSVYSPPFADLFTYTASERDLGNSRNWDEFFGHYSFIIRELLRVTKPGRLSCVHTSDIPAMAQRDGYIGLRDYPGEVIRAHENEGWVFTGRAFVQKNPQSQAIRVKSKALLFVQLRKDSSDSRPALIDQILIFKKPGDNAVPVNPVGNGELDNETWIEWAHGIWLGIRETETLQFSRARGADDEKHICPLQLGTIERCIKLYSNPGEMVLTPFGGIGSEAYMAVKLGRKAILIELKPEYFNVAINNLRRVETVTNARDLFADLPAL